SEGESRFRGEHSGYVSTQGAVHMREFLFLKDSILIEDIITKDVESKARLHFHPDMNVMVKDGKCCIDGVGIIYFSGEFNFELSSYDFAYGFNKTVKAKVLT